MQAFIKGLVAGKRYVAGTGPGIFRIGYVSDCHYDPVEARTGWTTRNLVLDYLANFKAAMDQYRPHLIIHAGDKTGVGVTSEATQIAWYQATLDAVAANSFSVVDGVSPGNHDFEYLSFASTLAMHASEEWMVSGTLYGYWESQDYRFISLDAQYKPNTQAHMNLEHTGVGYVNTDQLSWLEGALASSTKPVLVNVHQIAAEYDTDEFNLTKDVYHIQNRTALRGILESSEKVVAVIHGHMHSNRGQVINGIPYITCPSTAWGTIVSADSPSTAEGEWMTLEIDKTEKTIAAKRMGWIDAQPTTFHSQEYKWGAFTEAPNPLRVINPVDFSYVLNKRDSVGSFPVNLYTDDPRLTDETIRMLGRTTAGRQTWEHESQIAAFTYRLGIYFGDLADRWIRTPLANDSLNAVNIKFAANGDIVTQNATTPHVSLDSYTSGQWYQLAISVDPVAETYSVTLDDVAIATDYAFQSSSSAISKLVIATNVGEFWIDSLRIE